VHIESAVVSSLLARSIPAAWQPTKQRPPFPAVPNTPHSAAVDRQQIDDINIRQATLVAMRQAVQALPRRPGALLVDGNTSPGGLEGYVIRLVVGGDGRSAAIAAASVLAKVGSGLGGWKRLQQAAKRTWRCWSARSVQRMWQD
jgi:hypothetical protein